MIKSDKYIYAICRVDKKTFHLINSQLNEYGYKGLKAIIPTIDFLKKTQNGKNLYESIPLLFNYGFIKMKRSKSFDRTFMNKLLKDIEGIHSWVKSLEPLHRKRLKLRIDNSEDFDDFSKVAVAAKKDVKRLIKLSKQNQLYSSSDITNLSPGDYITLRGYPYDGMAANVVDVCLLTKTIKVHIHTNTTTSLIAQLAFENVLYSIYSDYDEDKITASEEDLEKVSTDYIF